MSHLDIVATLIDIAGAAELKKSDGRVLRPMLKGGLQDTHQPAVLSELGLPPSVYTMLRTDRYKLSIDTRSRAAIDLYDMQEDPDELHNLVTNLEYEEDGAVLNGTIAVENDCKFKLKWTAWDLLRAIG